jgi:fused signal recognition particle receptor
MRRWFRRSSPDENGGDPIKSEELKASENPAAEAGEAPGAAVPGPAPEEEGEAAGAAEAAGSPPDQEEPAGAASRPGWFRRLFRGQAGEEGEKPEETQSPAEVTPSPEPSAPPEAAAEALPPEPEDGTAVAEAAESPAERRRGLFRRLREGLGRTRHALAGGLERLFLGRREVDAEVLEELEELLITADLGVDTTLHLIAGIRERVKRRELGDAARLKEALREEMVRLLSAPPPAPRHARPWVILLVGVNGVGKTTTIAKLAHRELLAGRQPLLIAGDTFRAAAVEQLEIWGERLGVQVVKQKTGADPAAVVYDGLAAALAREADTVLIDTAGRLHTKVNLMEELKKIYRTAAKKLPGAPHETLLILDATTGQNALSQARLFHEAVGVTGIILTKLDGTAKGGMALAVTHETGLPLRYLGVGETLEDLQPFDPEAFAAAILG